MKRLLTIAFALLSFWVFPHSIDEPNIVLKHWYNKKDSSTIIGSFSLMKNNIVYIEDANDNIIKVPYNDLIVTDQLYIKQKEAQIKNLNLKNNKPKTTISIVWVAKIILLIIFLIALAFYIHTIGNLKIKRIVIPLFYLGVLFSLYSFVSKSLTITDPVFVNSAFTPFVPNVSTSWDNTYFYVESKGIPNHTMMVGISNHGWQQQVPIPQCYIGTNHWSIPLNPVIASTPIPIDGTHFTRGAIAIAANGVPIFNYHTNTGVDSYTDGQLDNYGGHCGRGDDYHYHIAPLHLYTSGQTTSNLPCAFSFDGFAVYGDLEPDGSPMNTLDANHGHYGTNGVYHYHGTTASPYMIGNMVGQVMEDNTHQLVPQAAAHPVRTENWTPLSGALITSCALNTNQNGYNVLYNLNGVAGYATDYSWSGTTYTFNYLTTSGTNSINYNGFTQCSVPLAATAFMNIQNIRIYPNPAKETVFIDYGTTN